MGVAGIKACMKINTRDRNNAGLHLQQNNKLLVMMEYIRIDASNVTRTMLQCIKCSAKGVTSWTKISPFLHKLSYVAHNKSNSNKHLYLFFYYKIMLELCVIFQANHHLS